MKAFMHPQYLQVHPLNAEEAPEDYADVSRFREWSNELVHGVSWDAKKAVLCLAVMWGFIERHLPVPEKTRHTM